MQHSNIATMIKGELRFGPARHRVYSEKNSKVTTISDVKILF